MAVKPAQGLINYLRTGRPESHLEDFGTGKRYTKQLARTVCADGFSISVQAGEFLYSTPRENRGPWANVECGFPSERPEPWSDWVTYCEDADRPTDTVYGYVPVGMVEDLIALHGGEVPA